jgi:hypothetical protein
MIRRIAGTLGIAVAVMAAYVLWARPYQLHWGATADEIARPMPGDELDPAPTFLATRAITINGKPHEIFPWLVQMGYGRAGFYAYDLVENLGSPRGIASADTILPEFQQLAVGDIVPISSVARLVVYAIERDRYLIWAGAPGPVRGGFTWALYPSGSNQTRLISRIRWHHHSINKTSLFLLDVFTEFSDHLAVRKVLKGIRQRVEGQKGAPATANLALTMYVFTFLLFLAGMVLNLLRPPSMRIWIAGLLAGGIWLITWYSGWSL